MPLCWVDVQSIQRIHTLDHTHLHELLLLACPKCYVTARAGVKGTQRWNTHLTLSTYCEI